jgi:hypothetical protein
VQTITGAYGPWSEAGSPVGGLRYNIAVAEPRDDFPNNFVGDLVRTERCWALPGCDDAFTCRAIT